MSVQDQSARSCFTHWLQDRSNRLVVFDETMVRLYQIYLGTQVQLHFWRKILEIGEYVTTIDENHSETKKKTTWRHKTAILGGFPCTKYLENHGGCCWRAKDCDVFTDSIATVFDIVSLYNDMVLTPLDLPLYVEGDTGSFRSDDQENMDLQLLLEHFADESYRKKERKNIQRDDDGANGEDNSMTSIMTSLNDPSEIKDSPNDAFWTKATIESAIEHRDINEFFSYLQKPRLNAPVYEQADWKAMCRELKDSTFNVPERFQENKYKILGTLMIGKKMTGLHSKVLIPINIILIQTQGCTANANIRQTVSDGFDLLHCAVGLEVNEDLYFSFNAYNPWAFALLQTRRLCLGPGSFHGCVISTIPQLRRIWKYIIRGFRW